MTRTFRQDKSGEAKYSPWLEDSEQPAVATRYILPIPFHVFAHAETNSDCRLPRNGNVPQ
jgi:hypothetical protein